MNSFGIDKGVTIRPSSTANLMVDSADRILPTTSSPYDFQITRPQSILNGYFTRIGTTEVVLEWCQNNVSTDLNNRDFTVDISGIAPNAYSGTITVNVLQGLYTAEQALNALVEALNLETPTTGATFSIVNMNAPGTDGVWVLECQDGHYTVGTNKLAVQLGLDEQESVILDPTTTGVEITCIDLRPYRFIDFVSSKLTYAQDLKDSSTQVFPKDILCRWYFAEDTEEAVDGYGFPILMGYRRFCRRRIFNPPKQIKWDNNLPIGNLSFQVYGDKGNILPTPSDSIDKNNWLMTLQLSEN